MQAHYTSLLISDAIIKRSLQQIFGEKLDYLYNGHGTIDKNRGRVRHDWLVLKLYEFLDQGKFNVTPAMKSDAKYLFNGTHKLILLNLKNATEMLNRNFYDLECFCKYDGKHEFDIVGLDDECVVGVEVKSKRKCKKAKQFDEQINRFFDFTRKEFPKHGTEIYYYNGKSGLYLIKQHLI